MSSDAKAYNKLGSDMTLIVNTRSAWSWKTNVGTDWTEVRLGLFMSLIGTADDNTFITSTETIVPSTPTDFVLIGLKNSTNNAAAGDSTSYFMGAAGNDYSVTPPSYSTGNVVASNTTGRLFGGSGFYASGYYQSSVRKATAASGAVAIRCGTAPDASTGYCGLYLFRLVVNNYGLSTQTVDVYSIANDAAISGSNYTKAAIRIAMAGNTSWTSMTNTTKIAWNNGSAALPLPDAFYIQNPFYSSRLRISAMDVIRVLPTP